MLTQNRIYYQENPKRLPVCTLPIHTLLHIADCIEGWGPVWCYWSYPMERFCGHLKHGGAASKRFPYKSLDRYVFDWTVLWHLGSVYDIRDMLKLGKKQRARKKSDDDNKFEIPGCELDRCYGGFVRLYNCADNGCVLTAPQPLVISTTSDIFLLVLQGTMRQLPEFDPLAAWRVHDALIHATFTEWTKFTRNDSQDTFCSASRSSQMAGARNAQYARVSEPFLARS